MVGRVMWALHRSLRGEWDRSPPEARRRATTAVAVSTAVLLVGLALLFAAPISDRARVLVIGAVGATVMLVSLVLTAIGAVRESRAANERRRSRSASGR